MPRTRRPQRLFGEGSRFERGYVADVLRRETVGGALLLAATATALVWANSPWSAAYTTVRDTAFGPAALHLHLSAAQWTADGFLAVFFFVAGLEVKREFVAGDLRQPRRAVLPVVAAVGGMLVPALLFLLVNRAGGRAALRGWAIPTATDIAFALAILAVVGSALPAALRTFLLTLAVVDDLLAIVVIALVFTAHLDAVPLLVAMLPLAVFAALVRRGVETPWLLVPLAVATWALVHASGVHATVAGVLLAFAVPVRGTRTAERFEHVLRPLSAGVAVPAFAFLATGVTVGGLDGLGTALRDPVAAGVLAGLVVGKPLGVFGATFAVATLSGAELDADLGWVDVLGLALLAGVGFTVSLLIGELAYGLGSTRDAHVKVAILIGSVLAATAGAIVLRRRSRRLALG